MTKCKLSQLIEAYGDGLHGTPVYDDNGEYYFINGNNLENGKICISEDTLKVDQEEYDRIKRPLNDRTILLSINGTLGRTALYNGEKIALGKSACYITVKPEYNREFIRYVLNSEAFQKYMPTVASGSTIKNFAPSQVGEFEIDLPLENQNEIAAVLSAIDAKIALNDSICLDLEVIAKQVYEYWFLQYDFPNKNGKPYKSYEGEMVWNDELKREIPKGWIVEPIGNHVTVNRGISYSSDDLLGDGIPMINLNSFNTDASYNSDGIKTFSGSYSKDKTINPYDLVVCATQQTAIDLSGKTNVIGKALLVPDIFDKPVVASMDIIRLNCDDLIGSFYLRATINHPSIHKYLVGFANGTKIKHLDINGLLEMEHEIPPKAILDKYNALIVDIEKRKSKIIAENKELDSLRDFLLPLLMNGQVSFCK